MKKKISVFALLLSLMLSLVVPVSATASTDTTADDVKYRDVEEFLESFGYSGFDKKDNCLYLAVKYGKELILYEVKTIENSKPYWGLENIDFLWFFDSALSTGGQTTIRYFFYSLEDCSLNNQYSYYKSDEAYTYAGAYVKYNGYSDFYAGCSNGFNNIVYSDLNIYSLNTISSLNYKSDESIVLFESSILADYSFPLWCSDAGLNCLASSNESPTKIPYSYNSYWHIVRKTSNGKWLLTTIGNSVMQENISDYRLYVGDNGNLHVACIYGGDDVNGYKLNVRQYEYDSDGWKVRTYETVDTRDYSGVVDLGAGTGFDDTRKLAYTNVDIFVGTEYEPTYPKSTEFVDLPDNPIQPDNPTPTPTTSPGNDSSGGGRPGSGSRPDTGGQATGGGGLDFIINLFTLIWTKICSIPMAVDGYSINLQQIVIYGALVSIVGGFIMHFIFGRK